MEVFEHSIYQSNWCRVLDQKMIHREVDPYAPSRTRTTRIIHRKANGLAIPHDGSTFCVWMSLVAHGKNLAETPTETTVPVEIIARESGLDYLEVKRHIETLERLGFVRTERRHRKTNRYKLFYEPLGDITDLGPDKPVAVKLHDVPPAKIGRKRTMESGQATSEIPVVKGDTDRCFAYLKETLCTHVGVTDPVEIQRLHKQLEDCIRVAGSKLRLETILYHIMSDRSEHGLKVLDNLAAAKFLGVYIQSALRREWLEKYADILQVAESEARKFKFIPVLPARDEY
jgi:hypothetical protein